MDNHDSAKEWLYFAQMDLESAFSTVTRYPPTSQISSLETNRALKDAEEVFNACSNLIA